MTHQYTLLTGGHVLQAPGSPPATAVVIAGDTVLLVGTDDEAASISRGDSMLVALDGAEVVGAGPLELGGPADFDIVRGGHVARVRGGRLVEGVLPGWHEHPQDEHDPG